jgi:PAS domain S-box-containing protein
LKASRNQSNFLRLQRDFFDQIANIDAFMSMLRSLGGVCFFMKDREGRFMGGNDAQFLKLGVASERDLLGKTDMDFFFPENLILQYRKDDLKVMRTGKPVLNRVEPVANPDGSVSWHKTSKYPLRNAQGVSIGIMGIMRDFDGSAMPWNHQRPFLKVMEFIDRHYHEEILVKDLAAATGLSLSQFERRFLEVFGQSPSRFLVRYRLTKASHLLVSSDHTISSIAVDCGFYDHSHFSRSFFGMFGIPPGQYRNLKRDASSAQARATTSRLAL